MNYVRNSVKITVDAYDGAVHFYVVEPDDPVIQTYQSMFPGLFSDMEEMPSDIKRHIRYPEGLLTVQAETYSTYHMQSPDVFYQREDVWQFATERYREAFQTVTPYYVMTRFPAEDSIEFVNILPFTPKNKNVINAWMAGRSDMPNYGKVKVFTFPKGVEVLGPRQIEARIDQNADMSRALSLWSQHGSNVIRGNLLAIPLFHSGKLYLVFVEPIFLQADDAQLPEIKRIVLADQDKVVWSDEFDTSLSALVGEADAEEVLVEVADEAQPAGGTEAQPEARAAAAPGEAPSAGPPTADTPAAGTTLPGTGATLSELARRATETFGEMKSHLSEGRFEEAGSLMGRLDELVSRIRRATSDQGAE